MVNYKDHLGSYKWEHGHWDYYRAPKEGRLSLKFFAMGLLVFYAFGGITQITKYAINKLPYWEKRVI